MDIHSVAFFYCALLICATLSHVKHQQIGLSSTPCVACVGAPQWRDKRACFFIYATVYLCSVMCDVCDARDVTRDA
jgi:hypothetical protein